MVLSLITPLTSFLLPNKFNIDKPFKQVPIKNP